jgi:hypothetical protein
MVEKKGKGLPDQGQQKNKDGVKTEARRRATEQGRDWESMSKEERKTFRQEARASLKK